MHLISFFSRFCNKGCLVEVNTTCQCGFSDWTEWGECTSNCDGTRYRYRTNTCTDSIESESESCGVPCSSLYCYDVATNASYPYGSIIEVLDCYIR